MAKNKAAILERDYLRSELSALEKARYTNWSIIVVAVLAIGVFALACFLPFIRIHNFQQETYEVTFGAMLFGDVTDPLLNERVGQPNWVYLAETIIFLIATLLPIFFQRKLKGALKICSAILIALAVFMTANWSNWVLSYSFSVDYFDNTLFPFIQGPAQNIAARMESGFVLMTVSPVISFIFEWIAYGIQRSRAGHRLLNDLKFGKKLLKD